MRKREVEESTSEEELPAPLEEISWWRWLGAIALAQESTTVDPLQIEEVISEEIITPTVASDEVEDLPGDTLITEEVSYIATSSENFEASSTAEVDLTVATSSDTPLPVPELPSLTPQFAVYVQLADKDWQLLGEVVTITNDVRFEIPKDLVASVADISLIQIKIVPLTQFDAVAPVYLDAMWLEVGYAPVLDLGVHGISEIVPEVYTLADIISESSTTSINVASTTMPVFASRAEFAEALVYVHGIDEQRLLVGVQASTTPYELWLIDTVTLSVSRIGFSDAVPGDVLPVVKDGLVFWLSTVKDKLYTFDMRTSEVLNEMRIVANLPDAGEYRLEFPFTDWQVVWRGNSLYLSSSATGELFTDENTKSVERFAQFLNLNQHLSVEQLSSLGIPISTIEVRETVTE